MKGCNVLFCFSSIGGQDSPLELIPAHVARGWGGGWGETVPESIQMLPAGEVLFCSAYWTQL